MILADRGYDAAEYWPMHIACWQALRSSRRSAIADSPFCFSPHLNRARNRNEMFFNKNKHCRHIATRTTNSRPNTWLSCSWLPLAARLWVHGLGCWTAPPVRNIRFA